MLNQFRVSRRLFEHARVDPEEQLERIQQKSSSGSSRRARVGPAEELEQGTVVDLSEADLCPNIFSYNYRTKFEQTPNPRARTKLGAFLALVLYLGLSGPSSWLDMHIECGLFALIIARARHATPL